MVHGDSKSREYLVGTIDYQRIEPLFGMIISSKMATLSELQTIYSMDDVYTLYDIVCTDNYNSFIINKNIQKAEAHNAK